MMGTPAHLVFPYLTFDLMLVLSVLGIALWAAERFCPSRRWISEWLCRVCEYMVNAVYFGALLSIPSIYRDAWKAGLPGPSMSRTAQAVLFIIAVGSTAVAWRASVVPAIRVWKGNSGLPVMKRVLRSMGVVFCPFTGHERFESREKV